jgi:hypothetical protein
VNGKAIMIVVVIFVEASTGFSHAGDMGAIGHDLYFKEKYEKI